MQMLLVLHLFLTLIIQHSESNNRLKIKMLNNTIVMKGKRNQILGPILFTFFMMMTLLK